MICPPCQQAGKILGTLGDQKIVRKLHEECRGGTWCDCAHATQSVLNMERIRPKGQDSE